MSENENEIVQSEIVGPLPAAPTAPDDATTAAASGAATAGPSSLERRVEALEGAVAELQARVPAREA